MKKFSKKKIMKGLMKTRIYLKKIMLSLMKMRKSLESVMTKSMMKKRKYTEKRTVKALLKGKKSLVQKATWRLTSISKKNKILFKKMQMLQY